MTAEAKIKQLALELPAPAVVEAFARYWWLGRGLDTAYAPDGLGKYGVLHLHLPRVRDKLQLAPAARAKVLAFRRYPVAGGL